MIVHRPESTLEHRQEYQKIASALLTVIQELTRKTEPLLEHEISAEFARNRVYGSRFHAEKAATPDFRYFSKKKPPDETPSLAVALRIDQSASMNAFGRLEASDRVRFEGHAGFHERLRAIGGGKGSGDCRL